MKNQTIRSVSGKVSGLSRTVLTTEKIAVVAPMPSASAATAAMVNPGLRTSARKACFNSFKICCICSPARHLFPNDDAAFHHERDFLQDADVGQWVAGNRDNVGQVAVLECANLAFPAKELRCVDGAGLNGCQRRQSVLHHEREFTRLRAMRERTHV